MFKRFYSILIFLFQVIVLNLNGQEKIMKASQANSQIDQSETIRLNEQSIIPNYVKFNSDFKLASDSSYMVNWILAHFKLSADNTLKVKSVEKDKLGMEHTRYTQFYTKLT